MHTLEFKGIVFNYNSDLSGDVYIKSGGTEVSIPGEALIQFVAYAYVMPAKIAELEQANPDEVLGVKDGLFEGTN